ncbi:MAG: PQQ-binding-like beta-propeller repeat protein [Blastocatellia bacterium]
MSHLIRKPMPLLIFMLLTAFCVSVTRADGPAWTHKPAQDIRWYQLTDAGTLLVGTAGSIYALDPENGNSLWSRNDLAGIEEYEVRQIENTPILLISDPKGYAQTKTKLSAVDLLTGKTLWETDKVQGHAVETAVNYDKGLAVIITVQSKSMQKDKLDVYAVDFGNGEVLWKTEYTDKVDLYGREKGSRFFPAFDLSGANPPLFDGDAMYLTYAGVHKFSLKDGSLAWKNAYDVTEGRIKRGNAQAVIDGEMIYTSAKGQLRAFDKNSGALKWTSKDFGGAIAEMLVDGGVIYGRLGGNFYDFGKKEYVKKGPLGVVAVARDSGAPNWMYDGAKNNITNMALVRESNTLLIADEKNLIGLDLSSQGKVKEAYKMKLEFKNKIGAAATTAKVAKIGFGAFTGGIAGGLKGGMSKGADGTDDPVQLTRRENGTVVIRGMQHLLAFDPRTKNIAWATQFEAPGSAGWQKIAMGALTTASAFMNMAGSVNAQYAAGYKDRSANRYEDRMISSFSSYEQFLTKRYSATKTTANFTYVMTNVADGKDKAAGIVGVNMMTGMADRQIMFNDKDPDYEIDETTGRVFNLRNPKELSAFVIR